MYGETDVGQQPSERCCTGPTGETVGTCKTSSMVKTSDVVQRPNTAKRPTRPTREPWFQRSRRGVLEPQH